MAEVGWTASAERDLREIEAFIRRDSRRYAALTVRRIRAAAGQIGEFPASGRQVPELEDTPYREIIVRPYRIIYRADARRDLVLILRVVHGSRLLPPLENAD